MRCLYRASYVVYWNWIRRENFNHFVVPYVSIVHTVYFYWYWRKLGISMSQMGLPDDRNFPDMSVSMFHSQEIWLFLSGLNRLNNCTFCIFIESHSFYWETRWVNIIFFWYAFRSFKMRCLQWVRIVHIEKETAIRLNN